MAGPRTSVRPRNRSLGGLNKDVRDVVRQTTSGGTVESNQSAHLASDRWSVVRCGAGVKGPQDYGDPESKLTGRSFDPTRRHYGQIGVGHATPRSGTSMVLLASPDDCRVSDPICPREDAALVRHREPPAFDSSLEVSSDRPNECFANVVQPDSEGHRDHEDEREI